MSGRAGPTLAARDGYRYKTAASGGFSEFRDHLDRIQSDERNARTSMSSNPATTAAPTPSTKPPGAGLEGIVATQSGICFIDGQAGKLIYRGYEIGDLVEHCTFEEVAYLLWEGDLPNREALDELKKELAESAELPEYIVRILKTLPRKTQPMDALRTAVSALAADDPDAMSNEPAARRGQSGCDGVAALVQFGGCGGKGRARDARAEGKSAGVWPSGLQNLRSAGPFFEQDEQAAWRGRGQHHLVRDVRTTDPDSQAGKEPQPQRRFLFGIDVLHNGDPPGFVHADFRRRPHCGMDGARHGTTQKQPHHPADGRLHWADGEEGCAD